ncbi:MAG: AraC family transcriptional regulator [Chitinophagaceae bacterium]
MRRESLSKLVEVQYVKPGNSVYPVQLTFFQIAYVITGTGALHINDHSIPYQQGNLMLLTPNDEYRFAIDETTEFLLIRFSRKYVNDYTWNNIRCMECVLYHASHLLGCVLKNKPDEPIVKHIADALIQEVTNNDVYSEDVVLHFANALIAITARNLAKVKPAGLSENADAKIHSIIEYVQSNIYLPDKLRAAIIADEFGLSETYLGSYFKKQSGETLSNFIARYKIRLIEHKLKFSDKRINEIVAEFGFADESHLNKFFKKHNGVSLSDYRKRNG